MPKKQEKKTSAVTKLQNKKISKTKATSSNKKASAVNNKSTLKRTRTMQDSIKEGSEYVKNIEKIQEANAKQLKKTQKSKITAEAKAVQTKQKKIAKIVKKSKTVVKKALKKKKQQKQQKSSKNVTPIAAVPDTDVKKSDNDEEEEESKVDVVTPVLTKKKTSLKDIDKKVDEEILTKKSSGKLNRTDSKLSNKLKSFKSFGEPGCPTAGIIDCVFCMDTTGSMGSYLANAQSTVKKIIEQIESRIEKTEIDVQFGFVAYRDHPPQESTYVTKIQGLCSKDDILKFINTLDANGGGDGPEAVMDGLLEAAKNIKWRQSNIVPSLRYIFHIADAPPHGSEYGGHSSTWSSGCPCGTTADKIAQVINTHQIHYRLVKIGSSLDKMSNIFKEKFGNFEECSISNANNLKIHISEMIMKELLPEEILNMMV